MTARYKPIYVRLSPEERSLIEQAAAADMRTLSDYVRTRALRAAQTEQAQPADNPSTE
jgi:uncharacterized protein (DUF1778 family)